MNKYFLIIIFLILPFSCRKQTETKAENEQLTSLSIPKKISDKLKPDKIIPQALSLQIKGQGKFSDDNTFKIELNIAEDTESKGSLSFLKEEQSLNCIINQYLRCWIAGTDKEGKIWRGYLLGEKKEETYIGELTISDDGASNTKTGTFTAQLTATVEV